MNTPYSLIAICAAALLLSACDKTPATPPKPTVSQPGPTLSGAMAAPAVDPSLPSAESALTPANAARADSALGRSNNTMSATQESTAMPMPGQNNDHSAPLGPARRASAP